MQVHGAFSVFSKQQIQLISNFKRFKNLGLTLFGIVSMFKKIK